MNEHFAEHSDEGFIIVGDLNSPNTCWSSNTHKYDKNLTSMIKALIPDHRHQIVDKPTKKVQPNEKNANILDVVIADKTTPITSTLLYDQTPPRVDHYLMKIEILLPKIHEEQEAKDVSIHHW